MKQSRRIRFVNVVGMAVLKINNSPKYVLEAVEKALASFPYPVCFFDKDDRALMCSDIYRRNFDAALKDVGPHIYEHDITFEELITARFQTIFTKGEAEKQIQREITKHNLKDGFIKDQELKGRWLRRVKSRSPEGHLMAANISIDELVHKTAKLLSAKQDMEFQALHDPLTGLPNRRALKMHLDTVLMNKELIDPVVVFHVDLDKFKLVNDTFGHDAGDLVLSEAAKALRSEVRISDFVSRVGGDEFVMVFTSLSDRKSIKSVAQRIIDKVREPIYYDGQPCHIGASIGIAIQDAVVDAERIIMDADIALFESKDAGRGCYSFFAPSQRLKHIESKQRIIEVREALEMRAFEPFFQPQICTKSGAMIGVEALVRWNHREDGIKLPDEFMPAVAEAGLSYNLDQMIIEKSLKVLSDWEAEGFSIPHMSVNLSSAILNRKNLTDELVALCEQEGVSPNKITFEILETIVVHEQNGIVQENTNALKAAGFNIALDDFGTGNASISSLRYLKPNGIKFAREFVQDIHKDPELELITGSLISLAKGLGMGILCEGVEISAERDVLAKLGCSEFQGNLFGRPMDKTDFQIWLDEFNESEEAA